MRSSHNMVAYLGGNHVHKVIYFALFFGCAGTSLLGGLFKYCLDLFSFSFSDHSLFPKPSSSQRGHTQPVAWQHPFSWRQPSGALHSPTLIWVGWPLVLLHSYTFEFTFTDSLRIPFPFFLCQSPVSWIPCPVLFTSSLWTYSQELPGNHLFCFLCVSVLKCS